MRLIALWLCFQLFLFALACATGVMLTQSLMHTLYPYLKARLRGACPSIKIYSCTFIPFVSILFESLRVLFHDHLSFSKLSSIGPWLPAAVPLPWPAQPTGFPTRMSTPTASSLSLVRVCWSLRVRQPSLPTTPVPHTTLRLSTTDLGRRSSFRMPSTRHVRRPTIPSTPSSLHPFGIHDAAHLQHDHSPYSSPEDA